jgi:DNA-binding response OmpR family regulator
MEELPLIMVIEDDLEIQTFVEDVLTEGGFQPAIIATGEQAVTLLKARNSDYRALVADVSSRGRLTGWDVARIAREIDPALPIIYTTAGFGHQWPSKGVPRSILLQKPFAPAQLVTAISQVLNTGSPTT